ncbi:hypothetical protein CUC15_12440 [Oceanobacillus zhaokaii]|uniref:Uncharacterized protein n=1 Tax=Oceanobacillus zhaokaii TaxID=2052660 RepID=A0A345PI51_9BACI|nr:hypothetical protein CUC15_12440 [Oceanobacillus zhaokaii]
MLLQNLRVLIAMLPIGCSCTLIGLTTNSPEIVGWFLLITGTNYLGYMGLILHLVIIKLNNN